MSLATPPPLTFSNLLNWADRDKSLLLSVLTGSMMAGFLVWLYVTLWFSNFGMEFFDPDGARLTTLVLLFNILVWSGLVAWGWLLRRHDRHNRFYTLACINFFGLSYLGVGMMMGLYNPVVGLVLVGSPLTGFILFDFRRVSASLLAHVVLILILCWLTVEGLLPYAPLLYADPVTLFYQSAYWLNSMLLFSLPYLAMVFGFNYVLLHRWRLREQQIQALAVTDPLTGLCNRRALFERFSQELARCRRNGSTVTVCVMDLDYFKQINDRYGHFTGDRVLAMVARVMRNTLRETDSLGRIGGEEFVMLLPDTDEAGAIVVIERFREQLARSSVLAGDPGEVVRVTGSFGITCAGPHDTLDEAALYSRADRALYQAKEQGRDRLVCWASTMVASF